MFIDSKNFLLNFFSMLKISFFICLFNLLTFNLIFASEDIRSEVEYNQILNISKEIIDSEASSEYSLRIVRSNLVELRTELLSIEKKQLNIINNINEQLDAVALPSINEELISEPLKQFKEKLNSDLASASFPLAYSRSFREKAEQFISSIDQILLGRFKTKLLSKGPSPLNIFSWNVTWSDLIKIKNEIITQLNFSNISTILGKNVAFFNPFILMVVGLFFIQGFSSKKN